MWIEKKNQIISFKILNQAFIINQTLILLIVFSFLKNGNIDDVEYRQRIIDTLVHRVYVFDTDDGGKKVVITYNTTSSVKTTVTLKDVSSYLKSSFFEGLAAPKPTNPNFFVIKHKVGIVIEIKGRD
jgi:hypothetical protein